MDVDLFVWRVRRLAALRAAMLALRGGGRCLPLSVYRVMVALADAGEPCSAFAVARRAGFLMETGRVKLHEARGFGVVDKERVPGVGVVWSLTDEGRDELDRVLAVLGPVEELVEVPDSAPAESAAASAGGQRRSRRRARRGRGA